MTPLKRDSNNFDGGRLRIVIFTEEDVFYLPPAIDQLLQELGDRVQAVVIARNPLQGPLWRAAIRALKVFGLRAMLSYAIRIVKAKIHDLWAIATGKPPSHSVAAICAKYQTQALPAEDVNDPEFLTKLRSIGPDLILCVSATQVFKRPLLELPPCGCINVHSSLLPKYRGLYPCFWAMANGETQTGVSVHYMIPKIDLGNVIAQERLRIEPYETLDSVMKKAKKLAVDLLVRTVAEIESGRVSETSIVAEEGTYYGWPTRGAYREFLARGHRLW